VTDRLRAFFAADSRGAAAVYLFGSEARGTAGPRSDVDVAVLIGARPASTLAAQPYALEDDLSAALGRRAQVVVLDTAPVDLVHRVLRDGVLVLERDRSARIRFEVAARNAYFDLVPHLERYRRRAG
jgi:predicted nucleotidyltransferase